MANDAQVENICSEIDMNRLFNETNVDNALRTMKSRKPGDISLTTRKLFRMVFRELYPIYNNIEINVISRAEIKIWETATDYQRSIYKVFADGHNKEVEDIFPHEHNKEVGNIPQALSQALFEGDTWADEVDTTGPGMQ